MLEPDCGSCPVESFCTPFRYLYQVSPRFLQMASFSSLGASACFFVWRLSDRTIAYRVPIPRLRQSTSLLSAFLTPDGERIIASLYGCEYDRYYNCTNSVYAIVCLQISTGEVVWEHIEEEGGGYDLLALSSDGRWLVIAGYEVEVLNALDGSLIYEWDEQADSAAFSPDNQVVALGVGRNIALYRMTDGALIRRFSTSHQYPIVRLAFSPDGRYLVSTDRDSARVWNRIDGSLVRSWRSASYSVYHAIFFGNDLLLTAGSEHTASSISAGSIRLWRLSDGALLRLWTSHS
jgi:WD40 repeat protein